MRDLQLTVFKKVVEKNSISLAAQELHMTQSAVSQQIQQLESYFGVKLFDRLHRRINITAAGQALYPYAVELETVYDRAHKTIQILTGEVCGKLRLGASMTIGEYIMPKILIEFSRMYPKVEITMDIYNSDQITLMVSEGTIDAGFIEGPVSAPAGVTAIPSGGDQLVIISPITRKTGKSSSTLRDLLSQRWVMRERTSGTRRFFEQFVTTSGCDVHDMNVVMALGSTQAVKEAVKAGLGIAPVSYLAVTDEVKRREVDVIDLAEGNIERPFTMLYQPGRFTTLAVEKFLAYVPRQVSHI